MAPDTPISLQASPTAPIHRSISPTVNLCNWSLHKPQALTYHSFCSALQHISCVVNLSISICCRLVDVSWSPDPQPQSRCVGISTQKIKINNSYLVGNFPLSSLTSCWITSYLFAFRFSRRNIYSLQLQLHLHHTGLCVRVIDQLWHWHWQSRWHYIMTILVHLMWYLWAVWCLLPVLGTCLWYLLL